MAMRRELCSEFLRSAHERAGWPQHWSNYGRLGAPRGDTLFPSGTLRGSQHHCFIRTAHGNDTEPESHLDDRGKRRWLAMPLPVLVSIGLWVTEISPELSFVAAGARCHGAAGRPRVVPSAGHTFTSLRGIEIGSLDPSEVGLGGRNSDPPVSYTYSMFSLLSHITHSIQHSLLLL